MLKNLSMTCLILEESQSNTEHLTVQSEANIADTTSDTAADVVNEKSDHKLLKHMLHKMKNIDRFNTDMVKAIKQSNRYLYQILRNQKILLELNSTKNIL